MRKPSRKSPEPKTPLPAAFHRIWAASAVSSLGDGVYFTALPLLALTLTHSSVVFGVMEAVTLLPWLLFGLIGGALVDRWDRRRTMVVADLCRAGLLGLATLALVTGHLSIALLVAVGFALGVGSVLFDVASMAFVPEVLDKDPEALQRGNQRLQGAQRALDGFVGPPLGSLLFSISRTVPFVADALSFLFSSLMIRSLPARPKPAADAAPKARGSLLGEARAGMSYLVHHKLLLSMSLRPAVGNLAFCAVGAVLPLYARDTLHLGNAGYGTFLTVEAVGGLAGTVLAGWCVRWIGTGGTLTLTAVAEAVVLLCVGLAPNVVVAGAFMALLGASMGMVMTIGPSIRQAIVPDELMGRVGAAARLISLSAGPLGALLGGWLAHVAGLRAPFLAGAAVLGVMSVLAARLTNNRAIEAGLAEAARLREAEVSQEVEVSKGAEVSQETAAPVFGVVTAA